MAYGLSTRASAANAAVARALSRASGTWGGYQAWRQLDAEKRFELVERARDCPPNHLTHSQPIAL